VALVGAPNVGKSSLVQALSSGQPEVCDYPFTTRSVKMGHFYIDGRRHQACFGLLRLCLCKFKTLLHAWRPAVVT
jgi:GTP1/Obg family GTP-binding protein